MTMWRWTPCAGDSANLMLDLLVTSGKSLSMLTKAGSMETCKTVGFSVGDIAEGVSDLVCSTEGGSDLHCSAKGGGDLF